MAHNRYRTGSVLFSGGQDHQIKCWKLSRIEYLDDYSIVSADQILTSHEGDVTSLKVIDVEFKKSLLSISTDGTLNFWDIDVYNCISVLKTIRSDSSLVDIAINGNYMTVTSIEKKISFYDIRDSEPGRVNDLIESVTCLKIDKSKRTIAGSIDGKLYVYDKTGSLLASSKIGHKSGIYAIDIENGFVASGDDLGIIKLWSYNRKKLRLLKSMQVLSDEVNVIQFRNISKDAECIVVGNDGSIKNLRFKMTFHSIQ